MLDGLVTPNVFTCIFGTYFTGSLYAGFRIMSHGTTVCVCTFSELGCLGCLKATFVVSVQGLELFGRFLTLMVKSFTRILSLLIQIPRSSLNELWHMLKVDFILVWFCWFLCSRDFGTTSAFLLLSKRKRTCLLTDIHPNFDSSLIIINQLTMKALIGIA